MCFCHNVDAFDSFIYETFNNVIGHKLVIIIRSLGFWMNLISPFLMKFPNGCLFNSFLGHLEHVEHNKTHVDVLELTP